MPEVAVVNLLESLLLLAFNFAIDELLPRRDRCGLNILIIYIGLGGWMRNIEFIPLAAFIWSGCAVSPIDVPVKTYNVDTGEVFSAVFKWAGRQGVVDTITPGGTFYSGEYVTEIALYMGRLALGGVFADGVIMIS